MSEITLNLKEAFSENRLEEALKKRRSETSFVNHLLFQILHKEFQEGGVFGFPLSVRMARTTYNWVKRLRRQK